MGHLSFLTFRYTYVYPDPYEDYHLPSPGNIFWKQPIAPNSLIKTKFWKYIRDVYKSLPGNVYQDEEKYLPYDAHTFMLDRGESPKSFKGVYLSFSRAHFFFQISEILIKIEQIDQKFT